MEKLDLTGWPGEVVVLKIHGTEFVTDAPDDYTKALKMCNKLAKHICDNMRKKPAQLVWELRDGNKWNDNWWFAGCRYYLHFSLGVKSREFCLFSCPNQPPSILPTSSSGLDRATYFLLSRDFVSHKISRNIFSVSSLRIANFT